MPRDLFQGRADEFEEALPALRAELARLVAPHGVYFVRGDVDVRDWADRALAGTGVTMLDDRAVDVVVGDRVVRIGGNRLDYHTCRPAGYGGRWPRGGRTAPSASCTATGPTRCSSCLDRPGST